MNKKLIFLVVKINRDHNYEKVYLCFVYVRNFQFMGM